MTTLGNQQMPERLLSLNNSQYIIGIIERITINNSYFCGKLKGYTSQITQI